MKFSKHIIMAGCMVVALGLGLGFVIGSGEKKDVEEEFDEQKVIQEIAATNPSVFEYIRDNSTKLISEWGGKGAAMIAREAFRQEKISMYECHVLSHLIGHKISLDVTQSIELLNEIGVDFCEGGFKHGLEAEIVLQDLREGGDFKPRLFKFCESLQQVSKTPDCYHGAGHELMRELKDIDKALALCDTLAGGPQTGVQTCYAGVFAEYTNIVGGVDGETGYKLKNSPLTLEVHPLEFCSDFSEKYQELCSAEVSGYQNSYHDTPKDLYESLLECTKGDYPEIVKTACVRSVGAVSAQHYLHQKETIEPYRDLLALDTMYIRSYIDGAGREMSQYINNGAPKNWRAFCSYFEDKDSQYCMQKMEEFIH